MIKYILISLCLLNFILPCNKCTAGNPQKHIEGIWLQSNEPAFLVLNQDGTFFSVEFWNDIDGESGIYDWEDEYGYGKWSAQKNQLCFQRIEKQNGRERVDPDKYCTGYRLRKDHLSIQFDSGPRSDGATRFKRLK